MKSAQRWQKRSSGASALLGALVLVGCTGGVASPNPGSGAALPPGPSGTDGTPPGGSGGAGAPTGTSQPPAPGTDPGRITMHRLNRAEYNNTVRDLFATASRPADDFPVDDRGEGFDNIADVLSLSSLQVSLYQSAAATLVEAAFASASARNQLVPCALDSVSCARQSLEAFTPKAWRRPVSSAEVDGLMTLVSLATSKGDSVEVGLKLSLQAVLLSPHFIFRVELDSLPQSATAHPLNDYELASRLSYFLWSTMPDAELTAKAASGGLREPSTLKAQVERMINDPKADAFVANFAGQWLETRKTAEIQPDPATFPKFDAALRGAMADESNALFKDLLLGKISGTELLLSDYIYANDRLAAHYGLPPVGSSSVQRVSVSNNVQRGGILGQASFLAVTSHPSRTSPVLRGKWVLNQLLCTAVPPPPPDADVNAFEQASTGGTLRQRLEQHRADPKCATCHSLMDPIGFGLENYDAIGGYRTTDGDAAIDSTGKLPSGASFMGMRDLATLLAADPRYPQCFVGKLYTYALGRSPQATAGSMDPRVLDDLSQQYAKNGMHFPELVQNLVASSPFLTRRGEPEQL